MEKLNIGKNIRQIRELKSYTQTFMADHLNMSIGGYSKIETGQTDVSISKVQQIADILETDLGTIFNFDAKNIFHQCNNENSVITGTINTQNNNGDLLEFLTSIQDQIKLMKEMMHFQKR
jgi:transcriptional regulator with XRE-family HTH domain